MKSLLKIGIAGYGIVGKKRHSCLVNNKNVEVVAVSDKNFISDGMLGNGVRNYTNYKNMLKKEQLNALFVCLTNDINPVATIDGLNNDLHVFCEKPPGRNLEDISRVIKVEKQKPGLKLVYGFNHRYHYSVIDALNIVKSGELGKIINMRGVYGKSKLNTFQQDEWRTKRSIAGGGVLLDQGIHMVDLMRMFAGEFRVEKSIIKNGYWGYDVEDNAYALMMNNEGIVGILNSSATQWRHRFNLEINLDYGSIILGGLLTGTKSYGDETLTIAKADHDKGVGNPKEFITRYNEDDSWDLEINNFINSIITNQQVNYGSSTDAFKTMKLVYQIYYSDLIWRKKYKIKNPESIYYD